MIRTLAAAALATTLLVASASAQALRPENDPRNQAPTVGTGGTLAMDHTIVQGNSNQGALVSAGTANFQYDTFVSNGTYGVYTNNTGANATVRNSIVTGHSYGFYRGSGTLTLSHNDVWSNSSGDYSNTSAGPNSLSTNPLFVSSTNPRPTSYSPVRKAASDSGADLGALPYTGDATPFLAGTLHEDTTISGTVSLVGDLTVSPGVILTFGPGTTVTAAATDVMASGANSSRVELIARGTLRVQGSASSPITFKGATAGASRKTGRSAAAGVTSSFCANLTPSATSCAAASWMCSTISTIWRRNAVSSAISMRSRC